MRLINYRKCNTCTLIMMWPCVLLPGSSKKDHLTAGARAELPTQPNEFPIVCGCTGVVCRGEGKDYDDEMNHAMVI